MQPGGEARIGFEGDNGSEGGDIRILQRIIAIIVASKEAARDGPHHRAVVVNQCGAGRLIARLDSTDEVSFLLDRKVAEVAKWCRIGH